MGSNIKRFQRNFGMTNSSLNYNSYAYNKDTKSAMKMSVPIWNDYFFPFISNYFIITTITLNEIFS